MKLKVISICFLLSVVFFSCNNDGKTLNKEVVQVKNTVTEFIRDVQTLESDTNINPIETFKELANAFADEKLVFTKDNIKDLLIKSRDYSSCVIVTANHTIVKIESLDDCQQSGSWKACMPKCSGYIKKGNLNFKNDYMNNIIGVPDDQERVAYFFKTVEIIEESNETSAIETLETPYVQVTSLNQPTSDWDSCDSFYCNDFYLTDQVLDYRPILTDNKGSYLFFLKEWEFGQWVFYSEFPNKKVIDGIINGDIEIPYEDHLCYTNSFDPCGLSITIFDYYGADNKRYSLGGEYSDIFKVLKWNGVYDYRKYEEKMLQDERQAYYNMKKKHFNNINNKYNEAKLLSEYISCPIPDTTINESEFESSENSYFRKTMLMYLKENYDLNEDSVYDNSNERLEFEERSGYYWDSVWDDVKEYYYSTNSSKLSNQIDVSIVDNVGEMDFTYSCTITFPNFNKQDIVSLLKILDIYEFDYETEEQGSCDEFYKEVYFSEFEDVEVKYNADSTLVEVIHSFSGGGC